MIQRDVTDRRDEIAARLEEQVRFHTSGRVVEKDDLRSLLKTALDLDYISESCRGGIETGNHYQSVRLGETVTSGFRSDRSDILDQIDFEGRTVLDLGSNLGEVSRAARARGACHVLGVEYDGFFVAIARALNVLNDVDCVEFRQGDIGAREVYAESFDIVLAFSVFQYVGEVIDTVCRVTNDLLVVETHKLDGNLESHYIAPVSRHLPRFEPLGHSDWGSTMSQPGERAVIAFARDDGKLARARRQIGLDVRTTSRLLHERFFDRFGSQPLDELVEIARGTSLDAALGGQEDADLGYRGWLYWLMYLKGYAEYSERGDVDAGNSYCEYFRSRHLPVAQEPGAGAEDAVKIAGNRFRDLDRICAAAKADEPAPPEELAPVRITVSDPLPLDALVITLSSGRALQASLIDGWHRIFDAAVCGLHQLEADLVYEAYPVVPGRVEYYRGDEAGMLRVDGWCLSPHEPWDFMELRVDGKVNARVPPRDRPDVAESFPDIPHAMRSGFSFTARAPVASETAIDLLPMSDWLPVGRLRVHRPLDRDVDHHELALTTSVGAALDRVASVVPGAGTVLAIGAPAGAITASLLPGVEPVVVEGDPPVWGMPAGSARTIVGLDVANALPKAERWSWLERLSRQLMPGGVLILIDRGWLPTTLPPSLIQLDRLPPEPVEALEAVILLRP